MSDKQLDLFSPAPSSLPLGEDPPVQTYRPDPDKVRRRLHKMLADARAAEIMPWSPAIVSLYQTIFPQMSNWLPEEEAAQLRLAFAGEMERLKGA